MSFVSLVLSIRLNTLTFKPFTTSETHIFGYGSLIILQLPLHLLVLILKLITSGLTLHARFFIEMQLKQVALTKPDKSNDPT